jgi:hypothetical protein
MGKSNRPQFQCLSERILRWKELGRGARSQDTNVLLVRYVNIRNKTSRLDLQLHQGGVLIGGSPKYSVQSSKFTFVITAVELRRFRPSTTL